MIDLSELMARFGRVADEYDARRDAAHAAVTRWEWYAFEAHGLRPLGLERELLRPGIRLAARPPLDRDAWRLGFDEYDRRVVMSEYSGFLGGPLYYETYRDYRDRTVEESRFEADGAPIYLHEYRMADGRPEALAMAAGGGNGYEEYTWTGDRVTRVVEYHGRGPVVAPLATYEAAWDDAGLVRIDSRGPVYERPPAGFTVAAACATVRDALIARVPAAFAALDLGGEPADALAFGYYPGDPARPTVHVGTGGGHEYSPADMDYELDVDLDDLADTVRLLRQEISLARADELAGVPNRDADRGRLMLCEAAAALNRRPWTGVTSSFVVYATDYELADLDRNMELCTARE